jgi:glycyl-tRNA synthetase
MSDSGASLTMQQVLLTLTSYWAEQGCLIGQPFNTEVGAGTLNPSTALRVMGPEPWKVAYVEPSVRPDDARYGENPNRLQTHTQFQVILKPDTGNAQEVYLGSLAALGIDLHAHDVRFVEDNWASPALGAWGLGWEVWLDGLEITQFTYFQQAGGVSLDPVSVEITYGIERIVMALQGVHHFKDIEYAPGISYGEAFGQAEYEMSRFYLDDADVEAQRRLFGEYAAEAERMLAARLPVPAHYLVLKCSHAFNVLDARGAVSTTERATAFGLMRRLSRQVGALWRERRAELGHPLGVATAPEKLSRPDASATVSGTHPLLFEIGVEELPAAEVSRVATAVADAVSSKLAATRLGHGAVRGYATPRRIVVTVADVEPAESDVTSVVRGPRASAALGKDGAPTPAALGFARAHGVDAAALRPTTVDGVEYLALTRTDSGRGAVQVLSDVLGEVVLELRSDRNMRWNDPALTFSRPIRWLLALLGDTPVPVVASALASGSTTRVLRTAQTPVVAVASVAQYHEVMAGSGIIVDGAVRREGIVERYRELAASLGGVADVDGESTLLDEVANLVERPTVILGSFDQRFLALPTEILTTVMRKHQRYLPIRTADGTLLPSFAFVANGDVDSEVVRAGNEAVLVARYADAEFFWRADLQSKPESLRQGLSKLAFEERLGSMADRADRIAAIAGELIAPGAASATEAERDTVRRAAQLAKFDLASLMVTELTSLAGTMARVYATRHGESAAVATALAEMEQPRTTADALPGTVPGAVLALADRLDLLMALFAVGANAKGSSDPFGLRRAALGALRLLRQIPHLRWVGLRRGLTLASGHIRAQGVPVTDEAIDAAHEFVVRRYQQALLEQGVDHRLVTAVLPLADVPARADEAVAALARRADDPAFTDLVTALQRARRIVPVDTPLTGDLDRLHEPAELALRETVDRVTPALTGPMSLDEFIARAHPLVAPIERFFVDVLVNAPDPELRAARLTLLGRIVELADPMLDWSALRGAA